MFCFILRGLPGSGKSTIAKILASIADVIVCSADNLFVNRATGVYQFDKTKLPQAHAECYKKFYGCILEGYNVVIDNTNTSEWEYKKYKDFAEKMGYQVHVINVQTNLSDKELADRNVHKVPLETITLMRERYDAK